MAKWVCIIILAASMIMLEVSGDRPQPERGLGASGAKLQYDDLLVAQSYASETLLLQWNTSSYLNQIGSIFMGLPRADNPRLHPSWTQVSCVSEDLVEQPLN